MIHISGWVWKAPPHLASWWCAVAVRPCGCRVALCGLSIYFLPTRPFSNLMSRGLRPADQTLQTDQRKKTKRTHRVRKLSGICLEVVPNKLLINPHLLIQSHLIHTCAHLPPTHTHTIQPCFPILCITFIITPTLQLLKYWWRVMMKPRSRDLSNPSQDTK